VHATPVAVEIVRHARQRLALAAPKREFGDSLPTSKKTKNDSTRLVDGALSKSSHTQFNLS
jgi:hypothetical protein